jgi:hypothetical protein
VDFSGEEGARSWSARFCGGRFVGEVEFTGKGLSSAAGSSFAGRFHALRALNDGMCGVRGCVIRTTRRRWCVVTGNAPWMRTASRWALRLRAQGDGGVAAVCGLHGDTDHEIPRHASTRSTPLRSAQGRLVASHRLGMSRG